jgi:hypothetical protein
MASTFSTVGVPIAGSEKEYSAWATRVMSEGQVMSVGDGEYRVLSSAGGTQLWAAVDRRGRVVGLAPHYAGAARCAARLTGRIERADDSPFDGALEGWAIDARPVSPDDAARDVTPLLFDAPDALAQRELRLPAIADVQIAAFAHECTWYRDVDAFRSAQATADLPFDEEAFAYLDVFADGPDRSAMAIISGRVQDTAVRVNELTGLGFRWAAVRTLIGEIDVVADPSIVEGEPVAGGVVFGSFWLSGRVSTVHVEGAGKAPVAGSVRRRWSPWRRRRPSGWG